MKAVAETATTRDRILRRALELFNERGVQSVTTAQIARGLKISEGNLWYHFRTKRELVETLFGWLEHEIDVNLSRVPAENAELADQLRFVTRAFEYLWEFRFFFREKFESMTGPDFSMRIQQMIRRGQQNVVRILSDMTERGILIATPAEINALAINAWIVHSNWLDYLQGRETITDITEEHIKEGLWQMMALLKPYWSDEARREAEKLIHEFKLTDV